MKKIEFAEQLIDELLKGDPNQTKVKSLMNQVGLVYTADSMEQMAQVLKLISDKKFSHSKIKTTQKVIDA